jgi:hypothetical protein
MAIEAAITAKKAPIADSREVCAVAPAMLVVNPMHQTNDARKQNGYGDLEGLDLLFQSAIECFEIVVISGKSLKLFR